MGPAHAGIYPQVLQLFHVVLGSCPSSSILFLFTYLHLLARGGFYPIEWLSKLFEGPVRK